MSESNLPARPVIQVKKTGNVLQVFVSATGQPQPIGSYNSQPPGNLQTYFSEGEVQSDWPNYEIQYITPPERPEPPTVKPVSITKIKKVLQNKVTPELERRTHTTNPNPAPPIARDDIRVKVEAFRGTLAMARQYANKKNQRVLDLKIEAIDELINEVFPREQQEQEPDQETSADS